MDKKFEKGSDILVKAVRLDENKQYIDAYYAYERGLQLYMEYLKECPDEKKPLLRERIIQYLSRAEIVKKKVQETKAVNGHNLTTTDESSKELVSSGSVEKKARTTFHEEIKINDNSKGYGYEKIFGRLLQEGEIHTILVEEPYLRMHQQYFNFIRFCELVIKKCSKLRKIIVITGQVTGNKEHNEFVSEMVQNLLEYEISLEFKYTATPHDRKISFSNGWVVKIGRGLHYFKPKSKFKIGNFDLDLAPCHECTVDLLFVEGLVID